MDNLTKLKGLPDYLDYHLKIIFVGYNPGEKSALTQHHYAGKGNQFWRLLHDSGLTSRLYPPEEDYLLLEESYGLTNIVARPSKSSSDLSRKELLQGAQELKTKIAEYQPKIVCLLGKEVYRNYAGLKSTAPITYGQVFTNQVVPTVAEFIGPNPSGRNVIPYVEKLADFQKLKQLLLSKV